MKTKELNTNELLQHLTKGNKLVDFEGIKLITELDEIRTGDTILKINDLSRRHDSFQIMRNIKVSNYSDSYLKEIIISDYEKETIFYNTKKEAFDTDGIPRSGTRESIFLAYVEWEYYFKFLE